MAGVLLAGAGCAQIKHFDAQPRAVCDGDTVQLQWSAVGNVTLQSTPPLPGTGPKGSAGSARFEVHGNTHFVLAARRLWSADKAERDIQVTPHSIEFGDFATCDAVAGSVSSRFSLPPTAISPTITAASVTNVNRRRIWLQKSGDCKPGDRCAPEALETDATTARIAGPVGGVVWSITVPLDTGQSCGDALAAIAGRLSLKFNLACGE